MAIVAAGVVTLGGGYEGGRQYGQQQEQPLTDTIATQQRCIERLGELGVVKTIPELCKTVIRSSDLEGYRYGQHARPGGAVYATPIISDARDTIADNKQTVKDDMHYYERFGLAVPSVGWLALLWVTSSVYFVKEHKREQKRRRQG